MKKKLALILTLSLVFSMMPSQASAALKSAGTPTKVQTLVSSEKLEHNFVNITADGQTLHIEAETPVKSTEYNISVRQSGKNSSVWAGRTYSTDMGSYCSFSFDLPNYTRLDGPGMRETKRWTAEIMHWQHSGHWIRTWKLSKDG